MLCFAPTIFSLLRNYRDNILGPVHFHALPSILSNFSAWLLCFKTRADSGRLALEFNAGFQIGQAVAHLAHPYAGPPALSFLGLREVLK